jgi:5-methyltetrahydrofolate--homocysteine methyltransferase
MDYSSFLAMAISRGLTMAIANPASQQLMNTLYSCDALAGRDKNLTSYVNRFSGVTSESTSKAEELTPERAVFDAVLRGRDDLIEKTIQSALDAGISPQNIVDNSLIPAITLVGISMIARSIFCHSLL